MKKQTQSRIHEKNMRRKLKIWNKPKIFVKKGIFKTFWEINNKNNSKNHHQAQPQQPSANSSNSETTNWICKHVEFGRPHAIDRCSCKLSCQWHSLFQPQPWCHQPQGCFGDHWTETLFLWVVLRNSSSTLQLLTSSFTLVSQQTLTPPWVDQASVNALLCCEKDLLAIVGYFRLWAECFASRQSAIHSHYSKLVLLSSIPILASNLSCQFALIQSNM